MELGPQHYGSHSNRTSALGLSSGACPIRILGQTYFINGRQEGFLVLNVSGKTTIRRPAYMETIPDVTFASEDFSPLVDSWDVIEDYTAGSQQYIISTVNKGSRRV